MLVATQRAHTEYVVREVRAIHARLQGRDEARAVEVLDVLWPDVRLAVRWCLDNDDADSTTVLLTHLAIEAWWRRPEAFAWVTEAVRRFGERDSGTHRPELLGAGGLAAFVGRQDAEAAIDLGERAMALLPYPGAALDCLPELAAYSGYLFTEQHDRGAEIARRAVAGLENDSDRWKQAMMQIGVSLAEVVWGDSPERMDREVSRAVALARTIGNPTLIVIANYIQAVRLARLDPVVAIHLIEDVRASAMAARNQFFVMQSAMALSPALTATGQPETALSAALTATDELQRAGWPLHAWSMAWSMLDPLWELGHWETAALLFGGCEASGVRRLGSQSLPPELEILSLGGGQSELQEVRHIGSHTPLTDLVRVAADHMASAQHERARHGRSPSSRRADPPSP